MATLIRVDMVVIYVRDWPAMLEWYTAKLGPLGLTAVFVEPEHHFAVLALGGGGPVLHLVGDPERPSAGRNRCVANILADDFDGALTALRQAEVEVLEVQDDHEDGYRLARIVDPEGNELNVYVNALA